MDKFTTDSGIEATTVEIKKSRKFQAAKGLDIETNNLIQLLANDFLIDIIQQCSKHT